MAAHCAGTALDAGLDPVIVVLGCEAARVEKTLAGLRVQTVFNQEFETGPSVSLRKGIDALPARTGAALFLRAGQPPVTAAVIRDLVRAHRRTLAPACAPVFEGRRGNPVLFDRALFDELRQLRGDTGGRALLEKYGGDVVEVAAGREVVADLDTPEIYERLS